MAEKQAHLNGGYYGPAVPPPQEPRRSYHRHGGGGGGSGCCCCLLSLLVKVIIALVVIIGVAILIFWLVVRPSEVKFYATDATLTEFNLTNTSPNALHYNLTLYLTIRNTNRKVGVYYDSIEALALYEGTRFSAIYNLPTFYQGHKNTTVLRAVFEGQQVMALSSEEKSEFDLQNSSGLYSIDVKFYLRIRFKLGKLKTRTMKPKIGCDLKVPLTASDGRVATTFVGTKCDFDV